MPSPTSATRTEAELIAELEAGERRVMVGDAIEGAVPGAAVGGVGVEQLVDRRRHQARLLRAPADELLALRVGAAPGLEVVDDEGQRARSGVAAHGERDDEGRAGRDVPAVERAVPCGAAARLDV